MTGFLKRYSMPLIAIAAALLSFIITPPSLKTVTDISWDAIFTLFMLLAVIEGFKKERMLSPLLSRARLFKRPFTLSLFFVLLVFFSSCLITNDASLIVLVPVTMMAMKSIEKEKYIIETVVLETIAANLGSMLTPFGNPQNLFIYSSEKMGSLDFISLMAPLSIASLILLVLSVMFVYRKSMDERIHIEIELPQERMNPSLSLMYICLFVAVILAVFFSVFKWIDILLLLLAVILIFDRKILKSIDYPLLITLLAFSVFSSSLSSNEAIASYLRKLSSEHGFSVPLLLSQVISNVPAAMLLYPFSTDKAALLYGVDIGGLGTLIASLASLISFRIYARENEEKGRYLAIFTLYNIAMLVVLVPIALICL